MEASREGVYACIVNARHILIIHLISFINDVTPKGREEVIEKSHLEQALRCSIGSKERDGY